MENKVLKAIRKYDLIHKGDKIIVALSGGADSTALLFCLLRLKNEFDLDIYACHINHLLRGEEAFRDERFVAKMCADNGVELFTLRTDVAKLAAEQKIGHEECGRRVRYDFFEQNAKKLGAKIATAHTATDSMETLLFNLSRGCGVKGACGIPPRRDNIIRPLILATRSDTVSFCKENGYEYITDSTNDQTEYNRNKIRHGAVPVLREINPSLEASFSRFSATMTELNEYIDKTAEKERLSAKVSGGYSCKALSSLPNPILTRVIEQLCGETKTEAVHIGLIADCIRNGGSVNIKNGVKAVSKQGIFRIVRGEEEKKQNSTAASADFSCENPIICNKKITKSVINIDEFYKQQKIDKNLFDIALDYDTISCVAVFRNRQSGDFFRPASRNLSKPLRKLMSEKKLPAEVRNSLLLLAEGKQVIWCEGLGADDEHKITAKTKNVCIIKIENL